jgi:hypothetical protein
LALAGVIVVAGCANEESTTSDDEDGSSANVAAATTSRAARGKTVPRSAKPVAPAPPVREKRRLNPPPGYRVISRGDGAVVYAPAPPRRRSTAAGDACSADGDGPARPARPGLSARRVDAGRVQVHVDVAESPGCPKADRVRLSFDVSTDASAPAVASYSAGDVAEAVVVEIPPRVADADVVRATVEASDGAASDSASVLIQRSR